MRIRSVASITAMPNEKDLLSALGSRNSNPAFAVISKMRGAVRMRPSEEVPRLGDKGLDGFVIFPTQSPMLRFEMQYDGVLYALIALYPSYIVY